MTVTVMAAMLPELSVCSTPCMIIPGEVVVSGSISTHVTLAGPVAWDVVSEGPGSVVACEMGVWPEWGVSVGNSCVVGTPVGLVLVSVELWLVLTEAEETSGGAVDKGGGDEAGG